MDNVLKKMPKYPDFDLEWDNTYFLGKPSQANNDYKKWQGPELHTLQQRSVTGIEITLMQVC